MSRKFEELLVKKGILPNDEDFDQSKETEEILFGHYFGEIEKAIKDDDLNSFIKLSLECTFDKDHTFYIYLDIESSFKQNISYLQLMAFFGSVKCFKYDISTGEFNSECIQKYAIVGGNSEIINILEKQGFSSFDFCFETAAKYFDRNIICDWLLLHYKC